MKRLVLILMLLPAICLADPTATPTPTSTPTNTPTPVVRSVAASTYVTVGSVTTNVLAASTCQLITEGILTNDSNEVIYLNIIGGAAVLNSGIRLNANGGSIVFNKSADVEYWYGVQAICTSGSKKLLVTVR